MQQLPVLNQINLIVTDMGAAVAFYRHLGFAIPVEHDAAHVAVPLPNGLLVELDSAHRVGQWDSGWQAAPAGAAAAAGSGSVVLGFALASRDAVDVLYAELTAAGHRGRQRPYDAFWGARYAVVEDPDGNGIGLMSPVERQRKFWPPVPPPAP